jgi:hypothetical protein
VSLKFKNPMLVVNVTAKDWEEAMRRVNSGRESPTRCCPNAIACTRALRAKFRRHPDLMARVCSQMDVFEGSDWVGQAAIPDFARKVISVFDDRVTEARSQCPSYVPVTGRYEIDLRNVMRF